MEKQGKLQVVTSLLGRAIKVGSLASGEGSEHLRQRWHEKAHLGVVNTSGSLEHWAYGGWGGRRPKLQAGQL